MGEISFYLSPHSDLEAECAQEARQVYTHDSRYSATRSCEQVLKVC